MPASCDFYLERAAECARAAEQTSLANVRERHLRSEALWRAMAERLIIVEDHRQRNIEAKNERLTRRPSILRKSVLIRQRLYG